MPPILVIPAVDWFHYGATIPPAGRHAPRLAAALGWLLDNLHAYAATATVGFFGETLAAQPELAVRAAAIGCEIAAMTWDTLDPWTLPPGAWRDEVERTAEAAAALGLPRPVRFLPPRPANQVLNVSQIAALRDAGIAATVGCSGEGLSAVRLAMVAGSPLAGVTLRLTPAWMARAAAAGYPPVALALTPMDVDPGAPGCGPARRSMMRRLPRLLAHGTRAVAPR